MATFSANTALAGLTHKYPNAFSIVSPIILDSRIVTLTDGTYNSRVRHMTKWGMTARELCNYIEDGIRKLLHGPGRPWQYIPDFDWRAVRENMGPSKLYDHLVPHDTSEEESAQQGASDNQLLVQTVCCVLDLKVEDVSTDVPLTAYGLDSLSAASLSYALRPLLMVSQIQLLADLTIKHLLMKLDGEKYRKIPTAKSVETVSGTVAYTERRVAEMQALLAELTVGLPSHPAPPDERRDGKRYGSIVVTGTTGSVGAHVLEQLLLASPYSRVYAFVRRGTDVAAAMKKQSDAFSSRGLDTHLLKSERLVVVGCAFEKDRLGLTVEMYEEVMPL